MKVTTINGQKEEEVENYKVIVNMDTMKLESVDSVKKGIAMTSIDNRDSCNLLYYICKEDVQFIRDGDNAYI